MWSEEHRPFSSTSASVYESEVVHSRPVNHIIIPCPSVYIYIYIHTQKRATYSYTWNIKANRPMIMNISSLGLSWASYPWQQSLDAVSVCWRHLPNATESEQRNIPLEPARAGVQDGLMTDSMVTDPGADMTTRKNTAHETTTTAARHSLQVWICGWAKTTSFRRLRTHQGKRGCLREQRQWPRIDQYF